MFTRAQYFAKLYLNVSIGAQKRLERQAVQLRRLRSRRLRSRRCGTGVAAQAALAGAAAEAERRRSAADGKDSSNDESAP